MANWPHGRGEMAGRIRSRDWHVSALGPLQAWPQSLRTAIDLMLESRQPACIGWGSESMLLYNDGYIAILGERHPQALGLPYRAAWPEYAEDWGPLLNAALTGEAQLFVDQAVPLAGRPGQPISWFTFAWSPLRDEAGEVGGFFCTAAETTAKVLAMQALHTRADADRAAAQTALASQSRFIEATLSSLPDYVYAFDRDRRFAYVNHAMQRLFGLTAEQMRNKSFAELGYPPTLAARLNGHIDRVFETGEMIEDEVFFTSPTGVAAFFHLRWGPVPAEDGSIELVVGVSRDTTERRRLEERLRDSEAQLKSALAAGEQQLRSALEAAQMAHWRWDIETQVLTASPTMPALFGGRDGDDWRSSIQGGQAMHPEDRARHQATVDAAMRDGLGWDSEFRIVRPVDGRITWLEERASPTTEAGTGKRIVSGLIWDVTTRKQAEDALRASEERFRQFGEASQDVLWIRDAQTLQWQYLTPAFETIYGLPRQQALAGNNYNGWLDLMVPEDRDHAIRSIERVHAGEQVVFEYRIVRPSDGAIRWLRDTDFPITDSAGQVVLIGGIGHDATELRETERRLKALVEGMPQLVWRATDEGLWTWVSPQWTAYTGQSEADSLGWGWLDPLHPDDRAAAQQAWAQALARGGFEMEYRIRAREDGAFRWFQTRGAPVRDQSGALLEWLGTSTDIHDLRELQDRQRVMVAELRHRTRNLMAVVRSIADKTMVRAENMADLRLRFRERLAALARVQDLLSRLGTGARITFDELLRREVAALGEEGGRITLEGPVGVALRSSAVQTLALGLHELATNAVKYGALSQPQGRLHITWEVVRDAGDGLPWLHVDWQERDVVMPPPNGALRGGGAGRELIERALPYQLGARTSLTMGPRGVHCTIALPIAEQNGAPRAP